jgi:hypothetical protein
LIAGLWLGGAPDAKRDENEQNDEVGASHSSSGVHMNTVNRNIVMATVMPMALSQ